MFYHFRFLGLPLFCVVSSDAEARAFTQELRGRHGQEDLDVCVTAADNQGAQVIID